MPLVPRAAHNARAEFFFFIWWIWWGWFIDFITIFIFVLIVFYLIISLVFIMILAWNKLNTVINSKRSLSHESILAKRLIFFALLVPFSSPEGLFPLIVYSVYTQMLRICANPTKKVLLRSYDKGFVYGCSFKLLTTRYYSGCIEKVVLRSSSQGNCKLDPNWVTGFVDGEGCFHLSIPHRKDRKPEWGPQPGFTIVLHEKDKPLLDLIKNFLGVGHLTKQGVYSHSISSNINKRIKNNNEVLQKILPINQKTSGLWALMQNSGAHRKGRASYFRRFAFNCRT